jgi:hypothetical protein
LNFDFEGGLTFLQNNRGIGGVPQTKLTISADEILSISRKWTSTCKSRDSRKSSKKKNWRIADFAFGLGCDCKAVALKHNDFMKHGANNLLLGAKLVTTSFFIFGALSPNPRLFFARCVEGSASAASNSVSYKRCSLIAWVLSLTTSTSSARLNTFCVLTS